MRIKNALILPFFASLLFASLKAIAVEALSSDELLSHCEVYSEQPGGEDGIFCVRYIQGFVDGAVTTDERVTINIADEIDRNESYTERVMRTRLGSRLKRYGPSVFAGFCLGEPVPIKSIVDHVVENLSKPHFVANKQLAREAVYQTLRNNYPCEIDS